NRKRVIHSARGVAQSLTEQPHQLTSTARIDQLPGKKRIPSAPKLLPKSFSHPTTITHPAPTIERGDIASERLRLVECLENFSDIAISGRMDHEATHYKIRLSTANSP